MPKRCAIMTLTGALLAAVATLLSCSSGAPRGSVVTVASASAPTPRELAAADRRDRCHPEEPPAPAATAAPLCRPVARGEASAVRRDVRRRYRARDAQSQIDVDFACDPLGDRIKEIVVEQGSGPKWSLRIWRLVREADSYAATRIDFVGRYNEGDPQGYTVASRFDVTVGRGVIESSRVESALQRVRIGMLASLREGSAPAAPPSSPPTTATSAAPAASPTPPLLAPAPGAAAGSMRAPGTRGAADGFAVGARLRDDQGRVLERWFAGSEASEGQGAYLPILLAADGLAPALDATAITLVSANDADRAFYAERLRFAREHFGDPGLPLWTRQAFVAMATELGSDAALPVLLELARGDRDPRTRYHAVNAIAAVTRWDLRFDEAGQPRPLDDVAAQYHAACHRR